MLNLYSENNHEIVLFHDFGTEAMVQANQVVIINNGEAMLLDPGGHKVYAPLFAELSSMVKPNGLKHIFFSHQDPDIIAAANGWLMVTEANAYLPSLWTRFITHFGVDKFAVHRILPIPDEGQTIKVGEVDLKVIPAHFLHSAGNFHVYDPVSKTLFSGDMGASLGMPYMEVQDFDAHIQYMEGFHKRYMASNRAIRIWIKTIEKLDIENIVPQHGAIMKGRENSRKFLNWIASLQCGTDIMPDSWDIPE